MRSIDFSREWDGDSILIPQMSRKQNAIVRQMMANLLENPAFFVLDYFNKTDVELEEVNQEIDEILSILNLEYTPPPMNNYYSLCPAAATVTSGNRLAFLASTIYYSQNTPATNNSYEFWNGIYLQKGTWIVRYHVLHNSNCAILKSEVIDLLTATVYDSDTYDLYNVTQSDQHVNLNNFILTDNAFIKLKITANGKNASSSNFFLPIANIELYKS